MPREIENLDIKIKLLKEFVNNGGVAELSKLGLVGDLTEIKADLDGKVIPETVSRGIVSIMNMLFISELMPPVFGTNFISCYSSTLQKEKSFDQINIDTEEQFDAIYEEFKEKLNILFRGQGEASWRLYNTLQRQWINEGLEKTEATYESFLEKLVDNGKTEYQEQIQTILEENHIDTINTISVLSYLQHHKCPTPLLDWTYSFGNSLYFALAGIKITDPKREIDEYFSVYYLGGF